MTANTTPVACGTCPCCIALQAPVPLPDAAMPTPEPGPAPVGAPHETRTARVYPVRMRLADGTYMTFPYTVYE